MSDEEEIESPESPEPDDPVDLIVEFMATLESKRLKRDPMVINDRERWYITILLSLLSDPHHRIGKLVTKDLIRVWYERGGQLPIRGSLSRELTERGPFEFAVQYLYDYGVKTADIARAFSVNKHTIYRHLKYLRANDEENDNEGD